MIRTSKILKRQIINKLEKRWKFASTVDTSFITSMTRIFTVLNVCKVSLLYK